MLIRGRVVGRWRVSQAFTVERQRSRSKFQVIVWSASNSSSVSRGFDALGTGAGIRVIHNPFLPLPTSNRAC